MAVLAMAGLVAGQAQPLADRDFVAESLALSAEQVELGRLALGRARSADVKQFAQQVLGDHAKAQEALQGLSRVGRPAAKPPSQQQRDARSTLAALSGPSFDRAYMDYVLAAQATMIALHEKEQQSGTDAELRQFASNTLTMLQGHLKMALSAQATTRQRSP
jgi:putative membrane protein